jgi:hypothetical protein
MANENIDLFVESIVKGDLRLLKSFDIDVNASVWLAIDESTSNVFAHLR